MNKLYKNFVFDIVMGVLALALGIVMLPPFDIGQKVVHVLAAIALTAYLVIYLLDRVRYCRGALFILALIECAAIIITILALFLEQFSVIKTDVCTTLGLVLWIRGVLELVGMYLAATASRRHKQDLTSFLINVLILSVGVYLYANPVINDLIITWTVCIFFILCAVAFGGLALLYAPTRPKKQPALRKTK